MQRLEELEREEYETSLKQMKEEIQAGRAQVRSAVERTNKLSVHLESQKQELSSLKQTIAKQESEISRLKDKLLGKISTQDNTVKEEPISRGSIPRSFSFSAVNQTVSKNEPEVKPRSGSDLTRFPSSLFLFSKNLLKQSSPRISPRESQAANKVENEISPRIHFLNANLRVEVSPRKERPADAKEKNHANDETPITKVSLDRLYSASRGTGNGGFKTLDKEKISCVPPYYYTEYMEVHTLEKRNLTPKR